MRRFGIHFSTSGASPGNGSKYSITCIQRPLSESYKSGLLKQMIFKCRFYEVDSRRVVVSKQWSLKAGGLLIQVISNTGLTVIIVRVLNIQYTYAPEPFPKRQILDSSKLKEFADDNFKFVENGTELFKQVENTVGKGEIDRGEQFLLFPQSFQNTTTADT